MGMRHVGFVNGYLKRHYRYVYRITNHRLYYRIAIYHRHNIQCDNKRDNRFCNNSTNYSIVYCRDYAYNYRYVFRHTNHRFNDRTKIYHHNNIWCDNEGDNRVANINSTDHGTGVHCPYNALSKYRCPNRTTNYNFHYRTTIYYHNNIYCDYRWDNGFSNNHTSYRNVVLCRDNASCIYRDVYRITNYRIYFKIALYYPDNFWNDNKENINNRGNDSIVVFCRRDYSGINRVANNKANHSSIVYLRDNVSSNYIFVYRSTNHRYVDRIINYSFYYSTTVYHHNYIQWDDDGDNRVRYNRADHNAIVYLRDNICFIYRFVYRSTNEWLYY
ncbi:Hypp5490 [Branchiostoma lanceolatum]|uniref:Hypp5490 protein n=1 Tax=Branchiostoma lanceolatum TaxID=7740 RepID=A0A8J9W6A3_BRALA|nr:Hypp5490 [Branchiostoma lanceolatum]